MNKRFIILSVAGLLISAAVNAMALGIGGYMTVGGGDAKFDYKKFELFANRQLFDSSNVAIGGGFVLDTNAAQNQLFNYRLKIGGERNWVDRDAEMKLSRLHLQNAFGFGVVRTKWVRFWLGPTIGASYTWGDRDNHEYGIGVAIPNTTWNLVFLGDPFAYQFLIGPGSDKIKKIAYGGIDFGLVLGLNINILDYLTIGPELGFKYGFNWGTQDREVYAALPIYLQLFPMNQGESKKGLTLHGFEFYMNLSVMYRIAGDTYGG